MEHKQHLKSQFVFEIQLGPEADEWSSFAAFADFVSSETDENEGFKGAVPGCLTY